MDEVLRRDIALRPPNVSTRLWLRSVGHPWAVAGPSEVFRMENFHRQPDLQDKRLRTGHPKAIAVKPRSNFVEGAKNARFFVVLQRDATNRKIVDPSKSSFEVFLATYRRWSEESKSARDDRVCAMWCVTPSQHQNFADCHAACVTKWSVLFPNTAVSCN